MTEHKASPVDRALQRELLLGMRDEYPNSMRKLPPNIARREADLSFETNLLYLEEHGFCDSGLRSNLNGGFAWGGSRITARGLDFLEDDGGLSAILTTVTVRLHADTVRDLLAAKIEATPLPTEEKNRLKAAVKGLSETALKAATTDLVQTGLQYIPNVVEWLRTTAGL